MNNPEPQSPILELIGVNKAFGGVVTANQVSFSVCRGEILGLIGPNGAGKTTMLNLISGIYRVDSGRILYEGRDIADLPAHKRPHLGIARTFQTPRFLQRSCIRDNLMLSLDLKKHEKFLPSFFSRSDPGFEGRVKALTDMAGLELDWDEEINSIPFGNRKLLEIVRALLTEPKLLLCDEPAAGLNQNELERVVTLLRYAAHEMNVGVILIEHAMDLVMNTCHRIVVLNFGEVIATGGPEEVSSDKAVLEAYLGRDRHA